MASTLPQTKNRIWLQGTMGHNIQNKNGVDHNLTLILIFCMLILFFFLKDHLDVFGHSISIGFHLLQFQNLQRMARGTDCDEF